LPKGLPGPEATITGLPLDRQFKVTLEALNKAGDVTTALTLMLYTGSFHVGRWICLLQIQPVPKVVSAGSNPFYSLHRDTGST